MPVVTLPPHLLLCRVYYYCVLKRIALVLLVVVVAILILAATRPDTFRVERTTTIAAPPEKVAALIDDFHRWPSWSPWEKLDPSMKRTFSGPYKGVGATYAWSGDGKAGAGEMKIVSETPAAIGLHLDFIKPFASSSKVDFALQPEGQGTKVTWVMSGPMPYISKVMCLFVSMDKMIGKDFESGLANLKAAAES
jgi:hypothetical protein